MSTLNIGGDKNDKSYRYKMPVLKTKIEGRGNGIKTVIPNMLDIAKSLHVDPAYPTKFFGLELGAQSKFDKKRQEAIVNGNHDASHLAKLLETFIKGFVLCPNCGLPEINMDIRKSAVKIKCAACGHHSELNPTHRLVAFILKNPSDGKKDKDKDKDDGKKKDRKGRKESGKDSEGSDDNEEPAAEEAEDDEAESNGKKVDSPKEEEQPVEFETDTSKEAALKRRQQELADMKASVPVVEAALANSVNSDAPVDVMRTAIARHSGDVAMVTSELRRLQLSRGLDDIQKAALLLESVIDASTPKTVPAQLKQNAKLLSSFARDVKSRQMLLDGFEQLVGVTYPKLMAATARILQTLYETDVLPEEVITAWYESPAEASKLANKEVAADIRRKAEKLIEWFKNAEEEDD